MLGLAGRRADISIRNPDIIRAVYDEILSLNSISEVEEYASDFAEGIFKNVASGKLNIDVANNVSRYISENIQGWPEFFALVLYIQKMFTDIQYETCSIMGYSYDECLRIVSVMNRILDKYEEKATEVSIRELVRKEQ